MRKLLLIAALALSGCSAIPSFWDDNENNVIVEIVQDVKEIDCAKPDYIGLFKAQSRTEWLIQYSTLKGSRDVRSMSNKIKETIDPFAQKARSGTMSSSYCALKKKILEQDTERVAKAMLGRF